MGGICDPQLTQVSEKRPIQMLVPWLHISAPLVSQDSQRLCLSFLSFPFLPFLSCFISRDPLLCTELILECKVPGLNVLFLPHCV